MTNVINVRNAPRNWKEDSQYVYIGRPSIFGNPVIKGKKCSSCGKIHTTGGSTLKCYQEYFIRRLTEDREFHDAVLKLKDKTLVCYCKPDPCHGDIIAAALDKDNI